MSLGILDSNIKDYDISQVTLIVGHIRQPYQVIAAATSQYANGPIEGVNRKIKALKRSCYGFANQEHMFVRIYQIIV